MPTQQACPTCCVTAVDPHTQDLRRRHAHVHRETSGNATAAMSMQPPRHETALCNGCWGVHMPIQQPSWYHETPGGQRRPCSAPPQHAPMATSAGSGLTRESLGGLLARGAKQPSSCPQPPCGLTTRADPSGTSVLPRQPSQHARD